MAKSEYLTEYDGIVNTMQMYVDGAKQGKSALMRPAFHPDASFFGYAGQRFAIGTRFLFDWIDKNGPAPEIEPRLVSVTFSIPSQSFVPKSLGLRTKCPGPISIDETETLPPAKATNTYLIEHDAITRTIHRYLAGARAGDGDLMRPAFRSSATISGYCHGVEYGGSVEHVFQWVTENGAATEYRTSLRTHRNHRGHRRRSSGSSALVRQADWR